MASTARDMPVSRHRKRMQAVRRSNTDLELRLRQALWRAGLRYRVNTRVEGVRPDVVFTRTRLAVFVDGCWWHGCPEHYVAPVGNAEFWRRRLERNTARDERDSERLRAANWRVLRFWGCEVRRELTRIVDVIRQAVREPIKVD